MIRNGTKYLLVFSAPLGPAPKEASFWNEQDAIVWTQELTRAHGAATLYRIAADGTKTRVEHGQR